jgi:cholesterol transport system auxiliary component
VTRPMACLLPLLLSACATDPPLPLRYDFGRTPVPIQSQAHLDATIAIPPIASPRWLRTTALMYRLAYEAPAYPRAYARSQWIASPDELLTLRLRQWVEAENSGFTLRQLPNDSDAYSLEVSLDTFAQVFSSPGHSRCTVALRVTLVAQGNEVLAQRTFKTTRTAPSADALGGVQGLVDASDADLRKIVAWLAETLPVRRRAAASKADDTHEMRTGEGPYGAHGRSLEARLNKND